MEERKVADEEGIKERGNETKDREDGILCEPYVYD